MATYYSYDEIHKIDAWQDNNITLILTQGEGLDGETGSNTYVKRPTFQLKDERGVISIPTTGARLELAFTRRDGTTGSLGSNEITTSDGENGIVSFTVKPNLTSVVGKVKGEIRLITSNAVIKFYGVNFWVNKGVSNQDAIESEDFDSLIKALQEVVLITPEGTANLDGLDENGDLPTNGTNPVASGVLKEYLFNTKMDLAPLNPTAEEIEAMPDSQLYGDTVNHKGTIKGGQSFYDTEYIDEAIPTKVSDLQNDSGFISAGQEIGYLVSENKKEYLSNKSDVKWDDGSISSYNGEIMSSTTRCRTAGYVAFDDAVAIQISVKAGYKVAIAAYNDSYVGLIRNFSNEQATYKITNKRYKFVVAYDDDSAITLQDIPTDCITVVYYARSKNIAEKKVEMATCFEQLIADTQNVSLTWIQGGASTSNGGNQDSATNRCRTGYKLIKQGKISVAISDGYMFGIRFYTSASKDGFFDSIGWLTEDYQQIITEDCYIRLVIAKQDNSDITPTDIATDTLTLSQSVYLDDTLTAENLPAQAKAVGDAISVVSNEISELSGNVDQNLETIKNYAIYDSLTENYEWVQGGMWANGSDVVPTSSRYSKACKSKYFFFGDATLKIKPKDGYQFDVIRYYRPPFTDSMYDGTSRFRDSLGGLTDKEITLKTDFNYIRFSVGRSDGSDITPDTIPLDCLDIKITKSDVNLPDIYSAYLFDKIQSVNDNVGAVGKNGETFIFITDLHWDNGNMKKSPMMVKRILDKTPVNTMICGGDLINNGQKDSEKRKISDCIKQFYDPHVPFPVAFGNHDANSNGQTSSDDVFTRNEVFALMMKQASNDVTFLNEIDWSFTYDRTGTKTRFLFIDTGRSGTINPSARQSVYHALNDVPEGYQVIVVAHWLYSITDSDFTPYGSELVSVLEAYNARSSIELDGKNYDYVNANGECKCIMIGHSHDDAQGVTTNGIPWILTDSDNIQRSHNFKDNHYRHQNTTTEQCFDVVSIDYDTGDIHIIRFGAGADRDFSASTGTWSRLNDNIILSGS